MSKETAAKNIPITGNMIYNPTNEQYESWPVDENGVPKVSLASEIGDLTIENVGLSEGTNLVGKFGIDQSTPNANEVVIKSGEITSISKVYPVIFHDTATTTGNGETFTVGAYKTLTLSGKGTSSSRTFEVHAINDNGDDEILQVMKNSDFTFAQSVTINGASYSVSIEGYVSVYVKITAIAGGNETIKGRVTA